MLEHISGLPDLILLLANDVFIRFSRCGVTRGTLSGKHVLTLIWMIMTGGSLKIVLNWAVLKEFSEALAYERQMLVEEANRYSKFSHGICLTVTMLLFNLLPCHSL